MAEGAARGVACLVGLVELCVAEVQGLRHHGCAVAAVAENELHLVVAPSTLAKLVCPAGGFNVFLSVFRRAA